MSVPLQSVPEDNQDEGDTEDIAVTQAKHEAAEIIAHARRQAEAIVAEARTNVPQSSPLAALGDNAEEIINQVRKLIRKQRELQTERNAMVEEIAALKSERDELVQRLTDAVVRMEELAAIADLAGGDGTRFESPAPSPPIPSPPVDSPPQPTPTPVFMPDPEQYLKAEEEKSRAARLERAEQEEDDTSLAARLARAEREEHEEDDTSLAARLERAEREESATLAAKLEQAESAELDTEDSGDLDDRFNDGLDSPYVVGSDGRSFYSRHTAKLPRLEGDGGRSVLSAVGAMRPDPEPKGRKNRRRKKDK